MNACRSVLAASVAGVAFFLPGLAAAPGAADAGATAVTELEALRALERRTVEVIAAAGEAFIFIEGGSGFLISEDGYILTNEHVVAGKTRMVVNLRGGKSRRAAVIGHDPEGDVALLKVEGDEPLGLRPLELGDSDALQIGEPVIALGDPFLIASRNLFLELAPPDYEPSASLGIVSALHRFSDMYMDAIQVDVAVNRGNSGGPLLDLDGKVVGINGKIETRFEISVNTGVGYAVPSNQIRRFIEPLKRAGGGNVRHGAIHGMELAERVSESGGLSVREIKDGSHAARLGIEPGDRILEVEGRPITSRSRYAGLISSYPAGHELEIKLSRGGRTIDLRAPLVEGGSLPYLGITLKTDTERMVTSITEVTPGSPADRAGLKVNDVVRSFAGKQVGSTAELKLHLQDRSAGDEVEFQVARDGKDLMLKVRLGGRARS